MDQKEKQALKNVLGTPLTREDHVRRKREALLLKEQISSIPSHAKRGAKYGLKYWLRLLDSCAARGLPDNESSEILPHAISNDSNDNDIAPNVAEKNYWIEYNSVANIT